MKTFGLFMILFIVITILLSSTLYNCSGIEIIIESTILSYIIQQYSVKGFKNK